MFKKRENIKKISSVGMVPVFAVAMIALAFVLIFLSGCSGSFFVPGASYGYFIWEDDSSDIHIAWSVDKKDTPFAGRISTDGIISGYELAGFEESDRFGINSEKNEVNFSAELSAKDFSDKIILSVDNYSYIEFDLKMNNGYDLSRINVGGFLNNPTDDVFRIEQGYFDKVKQIPLYQRHPVSGFVSKLAGDIRFTLFYIFLIGIVVIEILRITVLKKKRKYNWYLFLCYGVLILIELAVFIVLRKF